MNIDQQEKALNKVVQQHAQVFISLLTPADIDAIIVASEKVEKAKMAVRYAEQDLRNAVANAVNSIKTVLR